jgi:hypothetical protein
MALNAGCHDWAPADDDADAPVESSVDDAAGDALPDDGREEFDEASADPGAETDDAALESDDAGDDDAGNDDVDDVAEDAGPSCGNGRVEPGEDCEPGAIVPCTTRCGTAGSGACTTDCRFPTGDGCPAGVEICNGIDDDCSGAPDDGAGACPGCTVATHGGHVYHLCTLAATWGNAQLTCLRRGLHLVTLEDAAEDAWLMGAVGSLASRGWWIGLSDRALEGAWVWDGPPSSYTNWCLGEPNDYGGLEDCAETGYTCSTEVRTAWNDDTCTDLEPYVCEYP